MLVTTPHISLNKAMQTYGRADLPGCFAVVLSSAFCWPGAGMLDFALEALLRADLLMRSSSIPISLSLSCQILDHR